MEQQQQTEGEKGKILGIDTPLPALKIRPLAKTSKRRKKHSAFPINPTEIREEDVMSYHQANLAEIDKALQGLFLGENSTNTE
ncbi:hypothetical protein M0804_013851 [Polistes exclamans]|nr:hypothetical protein M0804_013851 [Polistes exclamans]